MPEAQSTTMQRVIRTSLVANVAGAVTLALVVDGAIVALGWGAASDAWVVPAAPPGVVVGGLWCVLFGLMGAARAFVLASAHPRRRALARGIASVLVYCAFYPAYTGGLSRLLVAEVGNVLTLATVTALAIALRRVTTRCGARLTHDCVAGFRDLPHRRRPRRPQLAGSS